MINTGHKLKSKISHLLIWIILLTAVNLTAPLSTSADPIVLYAAPDVQGSGDCSSWANTCTLQSALTTAVSGDEIWVKAGVHLPGTTRAATFTLKSGVALYGGFAGTETSLDQRDWQTNLTILSGDIDNNDTNTDGNFIAEMAADIVGRNAFNVVTGGGTDSTAVLDGFIVTAGEATSSWSPQDRGGGMYNSNSSPSLTNVIFSGNTAGAYGGGMYNTNSSLTLTDVTFSGNTSFMGGGMRNEGSSPTLTDVIFSGNTASYYGGGIFNGSSNPTLTEVTFSGNTADRYGGGMYNNNSSSMLTNASFSGNNAGLAGGGMYNTESSNPTLTDVTFSDNTATTSGGGMHNNSSHPTLTNLTFSSNSAPSGGGVYNTDSSPTLTTVTFSGNTASSDGGGMLNNTGSNPTLTDVTFNGNSTSSDGGGMFNNSNSRPTLTNVIMWGDSSFTGSEISNVVNSIPSIAYSDIQGCGGSNAWNSACGTDGGGNVAANPLFVDAAAGNLRLQPTSPAIDAGDNAAVSPDIITDLDGNPRFDDIPSILDTGSGTPPIVDMGAYEVANTFPQSDAGPDQTVHTGVMVTLDGSSSDPDGNLPLTYLWTQTGGTTVTLSNPTAVNPTFTAPNDPDVLTFSLTVSDSLGTPAPTPDEVVITVGNAPPESDAGSDQTVHTGVMVTLDGSGSNDPDGDLPLTYLWTQTGGTTVTLSDPTAVNPTFTSPNDPDVLAFILTVSDSLGMSDPTPDEVVITVENTPPESDAGPDQTVHTDVMVTLDGSGSSDPDGDLPLTYLWTQTGGTTVILSDPTVVNPTFTALNGSDMLTFTLTVSDSLGMPDATPDKVVITMETSTFYLFLPLILK